MLCKWFDLLIYTHRGCHASTQEKEMEWRRRGREKQEDNKTGWQVSLGAGLLVLGFVCCGGLQPHMDTQDCEPFGSKGCLSLSKWAACIILGSRVTWCVQLDSPWAHQTLLRANQFLSHWPELQLCDAGVTEGRAALLLRFSQEKKTSEVSVTSFGVNPPLTWASASSGMHTPASSRSFCRTLCKVIFVSLCQSFCAPVCTSVGELTHLGRLYFTCFLIQSTSFVSLSSRNWGSCMGGELGDDSTLSGQAMEPSPAVGWLPRMPFLRHFLWVLGSAGGCERPFPLSAGIIE